MTDLLITPGLPPARVIRSPMVTHLGWDAPVTSMGRLPRDLR